MKSGQASNSEELSRREVVARKHICAAYGKPGDEYGVTLFVSHHLAEIDAEYWVKYTGVSKPEPQQVLDILELRLDPEEDLDTLDFTLPANATDYVVCVGFDDAGKVVSVEMES
ncbi:MAG: DUF2004 domain-containing protein [Gammaproteobacteria bacterium]|nr:DUF2004 domain-containing protein [Gammaproteobacteria bacterium]